MSPEAAYALLGELGQVCAERDALRELVTQLQAKLHAVENPSPPPPSPPTETIIP